MSFQLHDTGEQYLIRTAGNDITPVSSVDASLYNDSTDALSESNDVADITTEPAGGSFSRQSVSCPGDLTLQYDGSTDYQKVLADQTFDTSDSSQTVDGYFIVVNYQADADGSSTDHLYFTGGLDQSYDLSSVDQLTISGAALTAS